MVSGAAWLGETLSAICIKESNMKLVTIVFILFVVIESSHSQTQESSVINNQLIVYGAGSLDQQANRAYINFTVKGFGSSIQEAVNVARAKASDIAAKLFALGLKESDLYTSQFNSGDNFEGKAFLSSKRDYRGQIDVNVTVDSLQLLESVVQVLASSAVDRLSNINFGLRSDSTMKLEARRLAVVNAQDKARLMASQLGVSLGKVLYMEELLSYSDGDFYLPPRDRGVSAYATSAVVAVGSGSTQTVAFYGQRFSVRAGVKVVYELVASK